MLSEREDVKPIKAGLRHWSGHRAGSMGPTPHLWFRRLWPSFLYSRMKKYRLLACFDRKRDGWGKPEAPEPLFSGSRVWADYETWQAQIGDSGSLNHSWDRRHRASLGTCYCSLVSGPKLLVLLKDNASEKHSCQLFYIYCSVFCHDQCLISLIADL